MDTLKKKVEDATFNMVSTYDWFSIIIDIEVEEWETKGKKSFVDSSVAVCVCKIKGVWTDHDLDLSREYRKLFHELYASSDPEWGSCRIFFFKDKLPDWHFNYSSPKRLNRVSDTEVDEIIDQMLDNAKK